MSSGPLYRAIYVLVHSVFTVLEWIYGALDRISATFVDFCHEFYIIQRTDYLKDKIQKRNKVPKHLTVLLGHEEPSYKDLANFVIWCLANQIVFLSFYDCKGRLQKHQDKLEKEINKRLLPNNHIIWHNTPVSTYKNGFVGQKIHIKILTENDSKQSIVNLTQNLCKSSKSVSIESIDNSLHKNFEFPDPDLGLYCGPSLQFFNYPPWQIRVTEFLGIKSHHSIRYRKFLEKLYVYSTCEQRLGK